MNRFVLVLGAAMASVAPFLVPSEGSAGDWGIQATCFVEGGCELGAACEKSPTGKLSATEAEGLFHVSVPGGEFFPAARLRWADADNASELELLSRNVFLNSRDTLEYVVFAGSMEDGGLLLTLSFKPGSNMNAEVITSLDFILTLHEFFEVYTFTGKCRAG